MGGTAELIARCVSSFPLTVLLKGCEMFTLTKIRSWLVGAAAGLLVALLIVPATRETLLLQLPIVGFSGNPIFNQQTAQDITNAHPHDFQMQLAAVRKTYQPNQSLNSSGELEGQQLNKLTAFENRFPENPSTYECAVARCHIGEFAVPTLCFSAFNGACCALQGNACRAVRKYGTGGIDPNGPDALWGINESAFRDSDWVPCRNSNFCNKYITNMQKLSPKVDVVFRKLFGSEQSKDILLALINSVVGPDTIIKDIEIRNPLQSRQALGIKGEYSRH